MSLTTLTEIPAYVALSGAFFLHFFDADDEYNSVACYISETIHVTEQIRRDELLSSGTGHTIADAFLSALSGFDSDDVFPATVALALRDLAHQAVDMVCERLSSEPLSSAVFAEESIRTEVRFCKWCRYSLRLSKDGWRCCKCGTLEVAA